MEASKTLACARSTAVLSCADVTLRLVSPVDRSLYRALYTHPEVMRSIGPTLAVDAADAQFERVVRHNALEAPGHRTWALSVSFHPDPVGLAALVRNRDRAEFGMMLLPVAWRRGVSRGVIGALLPHAFGPMRLAHVDVSRPDDEHVPVLDRMFAPFRFRRCAGLRDREVGWTLARQDWRCQAPDAGPRP